MSVAPNLFLDIGQSSLQLLDGERGFELPLERGENGRLTPACKERVTRGLEGFLKRNVFGRRRALCAIGARGVSVRRLTIPPSAKDDYQRVLALQIESQFPLSPDELAWGCRRLSSATQPRPGNGQGQEFLVVAVKKDVIEEYEELLSTCGLLPLFTMAGMARSSCCPHPPGPYAVLDIGRHHSELICFEGDVPSTVRILPWGGENLTRAIQERLSLSRDDAEKLKITLDQQSISSRDLAHKAKMAIRSELNSLAGTVNGSLTAQSVFLSGKSARLTDLGPWLADALGGGVGCKPLEFPAGDGRTAAIAGLKKSFEQDVRWSPLLLEANKNKTSETTVQPAQGKWAALAAVLVLAVLSLRYAEAFIYKPRLAKKIAEFKAYKERIPQIERELGFLQYLKDNQPPYMDAVVLLANGAPQGARIDSLSMKRTGELALRASLRDSQQTMDFRQKLVDSGFFGNVTLEEQTPAQNKVTVRISGQWKPTGERKPVVVEAGPSRGSRGGGASGSEPMPSMPSLPPGMVLPEGLSLPPGVTLPPGVEMQLRMGGPAISMPDGATPSSAPRGRRGGSRGTPPPDVVFPGGITPDEIDR